MLVSLYSTCDGADDYQCEETAEEEPPLNEGSAGWFWLVGPLARSRVWDVGMGVGISDECAGIREGAVGVEGREVCGWWF